MHYSSSAALIRGQSLTARHIALIIIIILATLLWNGFSIQDSTSFLLFPCSRPSDAAAAGDAFAAVLQVSHMLKPLAAAVVYCWLPAKWLLYWKWRTDRRSTNTAKVKSPQIGGRGWRADLKWDERVGGCEPTTNKRTPDGLSGVFTI